PPISTLFPYTTLFRSAVLNADDEECRKIGPSLDCNVAWFSLDEESKFVKNLAKENKVCAVFENGFVTIKKGDWKIRIERVGQIRSEEHTSELQSRENL